jgi:hypothetical protein
MSGRGFFSWIPLVETTGAFLAPPVLAQAFPHGLVPHDPGVRRDLREVHQEWSESQNPSYHQELLSWFLERVLRIPPSLMAEGADLPAGLTLRDPRSGETIRPTMAVRRPSLPGQSSPPVLLVLHMPLGLVSDGSRWALVFSPPGESSSRALFSTQLMIEEPELLQAFRTLAGFSCLANPQQGRDLAGLWKASLGEQAGVTAALGQQVRRAVEILIHSLDAQDRARHGELLIDFTCEDLYQAACTVMMRLVFLLAAEGRDLLPLGTDLWDQSYAVSTLRDQLTELANREGPEVLEHRFVAWSRLLATFRAVHGGIQHDGLPTGLPAYGGSLFDPDRFPFLEGRPRGSKWREVEAKPLPIDDRTVLTLLDALQILERPASQGGAQRLSFRSLDVEQIGHVYEGLLESKATRTERVMLGLAGKLEPEVALEDLETWWGEGREALAKRLAKPTGRSQKALFKALSTASEAAEEGLRRACESDDALVERLRPFAGLLRRDALNLPVVLLPGSVFVTQGSDRRSTGTHYTPRTLTEPVVRHTLEPLLDPGLAEGKPGQLERQLGPLEILDLKILDPACGSGAFLVETCRQLAEALVSAWEREEAKHPGQPLPIPEAGRTTGNPREQLLPVDPEERRVLARRLVADRCLLGVDKNPMAVEMAKLSLWLLTMQQGRPFTFLDHALRSGDSLLGVTRPAQLQRFDLGGEKAAVHLFNWDLPGALFEAAALRKRLEAHPEDDILDIQRKRELLTEAYTEELRVAADLLLGVELETLRNPGTSVDLRARELQKVRDLLRSPGVARPGVLRELRKRAQSLQDDVILDDVALDEAAGDGTASGEPPPGGSRRPFHWLLEFPEVFGEGREGVDGVVGNPPFQGGQKITGSLGTDFREFLVRHLGGGRRGSADLCAYFFLRDATLLQPGGMAGLVATNTIAQGDTREVGLEQLLDPERERRYALLRANPSQPWPGAANLEVALVWLRRGAWTGECVLEGQAVAGITAFLTRPGVAVGEPERLAGNEGRSFIGSYVLGMGFTLPPEEAAAWIAEDPCNEEVLFPYLGGKELNTQPDQGATRWVINFFDWSTEQAASYPTPFARVVEKVKPQRDALGEKNATARDRSRRWWQFARATPDLYATIAPLDRVLVTARVTKHLCLSFVPTGQVINEKIVAFPFHQPRHLALLQSSLHEVWARKYASSMRRDLRYTPSDCFETFPFPPAEALATLDEIGERYDSHRRQLMLATQLGLTKTYNRFHDPDQTEADIVALRELHVAMDQAVAAAYGWANLDLGHDFHTSESGTTKGTRFTISPEARAEILGRLLTLNHQRYAQEVADGLHKKKKTKRKARSRPRKAARKNALPVHKKRRPAPSSPTHTQGQLFAAPDQQQDLFTKPFAEAAPASPVPLSIHSSPPEDEGDP